MVDKHNQIKFKDYFLIPNLLSLFRIILVAPAIYYLSLDFRSAEFIALGILVFAGITDFFDGYLARKLKQESQLGLVLDPLADKLMTITLIVGLIVYRDFPLWLALTVMSRDLAILVAAAVMSDSAKGDIPPSDFYGKYYFSSIVPLLIGSLLRFEFGQWLFMIVTIVLLALSLGSYGFRLAAIKKGRGLNDHVMNNRVLQTAIRILWYPAFALYAYRFVTDILIDRYNFF